MQTFEKAIRRKDGSVSAYGLACGYIETRNPSPSITVTLWKENGAYNVRAHDFASRGRLMWETFSNLTKARKFFYKWEDA